MTIFASIARNRPEWIAQGLLVHAIQTEIGVRRLLIERSARQDLHGSIDSVPEIREEMCLVDARWRADVVITWPDAKPFRLELKLLAGFTSAQFEALNAEQIDLVVALSAENGVVHGAKAVTWMQVAEAVKDKALNQLLSEVTDTSYNLVGRLEQEVLSREFSSFRKGGPERSWPSMYGFLSKLHLHLHDAERGSYKASKAWSLSKGSSSYYGYDFQMTTDPDVRYWLGFRAENNAQPALALMVWRKGQTQYRDILRDSGDLDAEAAARRIHEALQIDLASTPSP